MKRAISGDVTPTNGETNPLKKVIPKRTKLRDFEGCSALKEYDLLEKIGEGTFGEVHKARHRKSRDLVALKRILMHNEKDGFPITALREIKILKMLSHPNIIRLSDMTIERGDKGKKKRGSIYMVTPYMDHDLCGLLDNPKVEFSVEQIKCYMKQLLDGTRYLHSMHILHRDMKAANLLISNEGILQIADFGLARMFTDDPPPGSTEKKREYTNMVVTRWYRPPELLLGERAYTPAIDLWGVGCILAEMYKGAPILQGQSDLDQLNMIFNLCGTPTESNMPGWTLLPGCEGIRSFKNYERQLERSYEKYGKEMVSFLAKLLELNPGRRLSASEALDDDYFKTAPLPAEPQDLPNYEASHEFDKRKHDAQRKEIKMPRAPDGAGQMVLGNSNGHAMAPRDSAPPPPSSAAYDRRRPGPQDLPDRSARDPHRSYPPRYDDRPRRDDRARDNYYDRNRPPREWSRERERDGERDRENHQHPQVDTYIPSYSKARNTPPRRDRSRDVDRYPPAGDMYTHTRDRRSAGRDFYDEARPTGRTHGRYERDGYAGERDRRRTRSRTRSTSRGARARTRTRSRSGSRSREPGSATAERR